MLQRHHVNGQATTPTTKLGLTTCVKSVAVINHYNWSHCCDGPHHHNPPHHHTPPHKCTLPHVVALYCRYSCCVLPSTPPPGLILPSCSTRGPTTTFLLWHVCAHCVSYVLNVRKTDKDVRVGLDKSGTQYSQYYNITIVCCLVLFFC